MTLNQPIWSSPRARPTYPVLEADLNIDVAIIGGGLAGLHTAWSLRASGLRIAIFEARRIGFQATGRSTAKVTSQHGVRYARLIKKLGQEHARLYAKENQRAVEIIAALSATMPYGASFETCDAFVIARNDSEARQLPSEKDAARSLGLPATLELPEASPITCRSAMRFSSQGQFDPVAYQVGLAALVASHTEIYEDSRVVSVDDGEPATLSVNGRTVRANTVVIATQIPFISEGKFFTRAFPFAHAAAAAPYQSEHSLTGMYITASAPSFSLRTALADGTRYLVVAGPEYKPGEPAGQAKAVDMLIKFMSDEFALKPTHLWTNEDFRPSDGLPYVGQASGTTKSLLVATGFDAWGITNSVLAGDLLASLITRQRHPAEALFDPQRSDIVRGAGEFLKSNAAAGVHLAADRLLRAKAVASPPIEPGRGAVFKDGGEQLAVSRSVDGELTALSAVCTHLGCIVDWNTIDQTWDCPCHGSRFDHAGRVLAGPATKDLEPRPAPKKVGMR
jgi:glycine/D-amino acid oxidase-like deaminating enzyme/nitrite reductase/ring-hydroxylating ferredoxin subunit